MINDYADRIKELTLMDDEFMVLCLENCNEAIELIIRTILGRDDLKVVDSNVQKLLKNLAGRDVVLDIVAEDSDGNYIDIEIQRAKEKSFQRRARYHSSLIDAHMLEKNTKFYELKESYVIFITETDFIGRGLPIYRIESSFTDNNEQFDDGRHIMYVNGSHQDVSTELGKLVHDLSCRNVGEMYNSILADRVRTFKETDGGERHMGPVFEKFKDEITAEVSESKQIEFAMKLISMEKFSSDDIAEATGLSLEQVLELMQPATV